MSDATTLTDRPLSGRHIVITRPPEQSEDFSRLLEAAGARVTVASAIAIAPLEDTAELDAALDQIETFDWVVLTSVNGVRAVGDRLRALGRGWPMPGYGATKFAVIGPATARELEVCGIHADFMPEEYVAEAVAQGLQELGGGAARRVLLLRADIARRALADELRAQGAVVVEAAAYRTVVQPVEDAVLRRLLYDPDERPDALTFTSSSTVHGVMHSLTALGEMPEQALTHIALAAIGPITAGTLRQYRLEPNIVAAEYTIPGLLQALIAYFVARPS